MGDELGRDHRHQVGLEGQRRVRRADHVAVTDMDPVEGSDRDRACGRPLRRSARSGASARSLASVAGGRGRVRGNGRRSRVAALIPCRPICTRGAVTLAERRRARAVLVGEEHRADDPARLRSGARVGRRRPPAPLTARKLAEARPGAGHVEHARRSLARPGADAPRRARWRAAAAPRSRHRRGPRPASARRCPTSRRNAGRGVARSATSPGTVDRYLALGRSRPPRLGARARRRARRRP